MEVNLNKKRKAILLIGIVVFSVLIWNRATSNKEELEKNCKTFVKNNGCYLASEDIDNFEAGMKLKELTEETGYNSPKEACGCITYNITDL